MSTVGGGKLRFYLLMVTEHAVYTRGVHCATLSSCFVVELDRLERDLNHSPHDPSSLLRTTIIIIQRYIMIEFRCVVTVSTPAVWLARENIKRLTPRPCINVEYSHRVVYIEECTTSVFH